ncbi:hypothetical protein FXO38_15425 [Capsicum annuum]|nr:hypothetical protein FXO37_32856 [Capsicum annuum]KAF3653913.1 hypothetical protein FXO38_15425 [Capsicum annuum]
MERVFSRLAMLLELGGYAVEPVPTRHRYGRRRGIRLNESRDVDQHQEESWLRYRKGETRKKEKVDDCDCCRWERVSSPEFRWGRKRKWYYAQICDCQLSPAKGLSPAEGLSSPELMGKKE